MDLNSKTAIEEMEVPVQNVNQHTMMEEIISDEVVMLLSCHHADAG